MLRMASFLTYRGTEVITRRQIFWTASILHQLVLDIRGAQIGPAYDSTDLMYIRYIRIFDLIGTGLLRFITGESMPRIFEHFCITFLMC